MIRRFVLASTVLLALVAPAAATPLCLTGSGSSGLRVQVHLGTPMSEADRMEFDKMRLRRAGIDADTVERDSFGCLKVTRFENGRWHTEFYDPDTFEQKPLNLQLR